MANDIKQCRCKNCLHNTKDINIKTDEYHNNGSAYYHKECWDAKERIDRIKEIWEKEINEFVVWAQLVRMLNDLIYKQKKDSEYILFAIEYAAKHKSKYRLAHPGGIKYILGKPEIKEEFEKSKRKIFKDSDFKIEKPTQNNAPKFTTKKQTSGFGGIFGGSY